MLAAVSRCVQTLLILVLTYLVSRCVSDVAKRVMFVFWSLLVCIQCRSVSYWFEQMLKGFLFSIVECAGLILEHTRLVGLTNRVWGGGHNM